MSGGQSSENGRRYTPYSLALILRTRKLRWPYIPPSFGTVMGPVEVDNKDEGRNKGRTRISVGRGMEVNCPFIRDPIITPPTVVYLSKQTVSTPKWKFRISAFSYTPPGLHVAKRLLETLVVSTRSSKMFKYIFRNRNHEILKYYNIVAL